MIRSFYILSTGTELTTGRSRDSNSSRIASSLAEAGYGVAGLGVFPDDPERLEKEIQFRMNSDEISGIIMTGGLGPTADDHTVDVLARICGCSTTEDPVALQKLEERALLFPERINLEFARRQVRIPEKAKALPNPNGIAPGILLTINKGSLPKIIAAMPGFPQEMEPILENSLLSEIRKLYQPEKLHREVFHLYGINESSFQMDFFRNNENVPEDLNWGVSASAGQIKVFLESNTEVALQNLVSRAKELYKDRFLARTVLEELHSLGKEKRLQIGTAESCTGGLIAKQLTDLPGSSDFFAGSIISYSNQVKIDHLGVESSVLEKSGAVSDPVARQMALGLVRKLNLDYGVAVTGIAGPGGGSSEKPVGTVFIACASRNGQVSSMKVFFPLDRERVREYTAGSALHFLYRFIVENDALP